MTTNDARKTVESFVPIENWTAPRIYNLSRIDPRAELVLLAVQYLDSRGALKRQPGAEHLVQLRDT